MFHCDGIVCFKDSNLDKRHLEGIHSLVFLNERNGCMKNRDILFKKELFVCGSFEIL